MRIRAIAISCALLLTAACSSNSSPNKHGDTNEPAYGAEIAKALHEAHSGSQLLCGGARVVVSSPNSSKRSAVGACGTVRSNIATMNIDALGEVASKVIVAGRTRLLPPDGQLKVHVAVGGYVEVSQDKKLTLGAAAWRVLTHQRPKAKQQSSTYFGCLRHSGVAHCLDVVEPDVFPSISAALAEPEVVKALAKLLKSVATTSYVTEVDSPESERRLPLLGINVNPDLTGIGQVKPPKITLTADGHTFAKQIHWSSWGGEQAMGTGEADYGNALEPVTVVAYNLGTCEGYKAYQRVTWFFPGHGQKFAAVGGFRTCTKLGGFAKRRG